MQLRFSDDNGRAGKVYSSSSDGIMVYSGTEAYKYWATGSKLK